MIDRWNFEQALYFSQYTLLYHRPNTESIYDVLSVWVRSKIYSKTNLNVCTASAGNRTRVAHLGGEHSTIEPPMLREFSLFSHFINYLSTNATLFFSESWNDSKKWTDFLDGDKPCLKFVLRPDSPYMNCRRSALITVYPAITFYLLSLSLSLSLVRSFSLHMGRCISEHCAISVVWKSKAMRSVFL